MMKESPVLVGIFGILQFILIALKVMCVINWSWWFVFAPYFAGNALLVFVLIKAIIMDQFD